MRKKIILTGGGTAGHVIPCLSVGESLDRDFWEIHYIGRQDGIEKELATKRGYIYHSINPPKFARNKPLSLLTMPFKLRAAKKAAKLILDEVNPDVIFSKGGFVSLPVTLANKKTPAIMHESDLSFGLANRIAFKRCTVCSTFPMGNKKVITVGSPLSRDIWNATADFARRVCGFKRAKPVLLITGGSLGALALNNLVQGDLDKLINHYNIIHLTGRGYNYTEQEGYKAIEFTHNIYSFMKYADFAVTRGGSNTIFELAALNVPSLIIPLPKGVSRGDQVENAEYFASHNFAMQVSQEAVQNSGLMPHLDALCRNKAEIASTLQDTDFDGTKKIIELINRHCK